MTSNEHDETTASDLDTILSRIRDGVVSFDADYRFTYLNDRAVALLERSRTDLLGTVLWDAFPDLDEGTRQHFERAMATQAPHTFERHSDDLDRWFEVSLSPSATGLSVSFADITERKTRMTSLERERDLTEQLLRASPVGVCVLDADGQFRRVNERAEEILGVSRDRIVDDSYQNPDWRVQRPDGTPLPDEEFPFAIALGTGEPTFDHEQTLERPDGTRIWVSVSAAPVRCSAGAVDRVVVTFEDISEQKAQQARLEADEAKYRSLFEGTLDALLVTDDDGYYTDANAAACELLGLDRSAVLGRHISEFAPPDYDFEAAWGDFLDGDGIRGEFPLQRDDGTIRVTEFSATRNVFPGHHLSALRDITEQKERDERLRASERKFRSVFEGTLDALLLTDEDGYYVDVNPAACELYGLEYDELVGCHATEFAPDSFDFAAAWRAIEDGSGLQGEFPLERRDGTIRMTAYSATPNVFGGHHFFALRDVTERHENERVRREQRRELARLNHVNTLFREITRTIVGAETRSTIERAVTETLVDTDLYSLAMTSTVASDRQVEVTSLAGVDAAERDALLDPIRSTFDEAIRTVAATNQPVITDSLADDVDADERTFLTAFGIASVGHFPLAADGTVYGVLTLGATDVDVFTESERALFVDFGHLLGKTFAAIQTEKLLHGEVVLDLEFALPTESSLVARLSDRGDCACHLSGIVPVGDDVLYYLTLPDADSRRICALAAELPGVRSARVIERSGGSLIELRVDDDPAIQALLAGDSWPRRGEFDRGDGRLVVEVPADTDVRSFVETVTEQVPGLSLLAKHEREQSLPATGTLHQQLQALLTERQRAILEAAYRAGYFEWPTRRTTGADLAEAFDISASTFHQHLRVAVSKLLEHYLAQSR